MFGLMDECIEKYDELIKKYNKEAKEHERLKRRYNELVIDVDTMRLETEIDNTKISNGLAKILERQIELGYW